MSLINRMLQDLDRRNAIPGKDGKLPPQQVRPVPPERAPQAVLWRALAGLVIAALGAGAWITYEAKRPRAVLTERAFMADEKPVPARPAPAAPVVNPPAPSVPAPEQAQKEQPPAAEPLQKPAEMESFKLALSIDTPIGDKDRARPAASRRVPQSAAAARTTGPELAADAPPPTRLDRREQPPSVGGRAEVEFRKAVSLLSSGRASEAEEALYAALASDPAHEAARQALVALLLEQHRTDEASRLLQQGLSLHPEQVQFATALAGIQAEHGEVAAAAQTLEQAKAAAGGDPQYNFVLGGVLQRLSKHEEAAQAYRASLIAAPEYGPSWIGLAVCLEALNHKPEAAEAFRRALNTRGLSADVRSYAEQKVLQLR